MSGEQWIRAAREQDLREGVPLSARAGKSKVLLVRLGEHIYACGSECTHYGAPLSEGLLMGHVITCPWHNARFDVTTGRMIAPPALDGLSCHPVKVEGGYVLVGTGREPSRPAVRPGDARTFVIVGAGAAGNAAAETLRQEGFGGRILLITAEPDGPYDRTALSKDFMAGETSRKWLPLRREAFYQELGIELLTGRRVTGFDPSARVVSFADGSQVAFDRALLATGGVPRLPTIPGTDLEGFFVLRSLQNAEAILAAAAQAQRAVILGAGFLGMEVAASLRSRGIEVHVVGPEPVPLARVFGEQVGRWLQRLHEEQGVRFHLGSAVEGISGDGRVREVALSDGSRVAADLVLAAVGIMPAVDYLGGTGLLDGGAVPVDGRLQTKAEGSYAAGDIAVVPDRRTGEPQRVEHWVVAERQGQHAARAMLGSDAPYDEIPFFWTRHFGTSVKHVGFAREWDAVAVRGNLDAGSFLAGYYGNGRLKAVSAVGYAREVIALGELLKAGRSVPPAELADESTDLVQLVPRA